MDQARGMPLGKNWKVVYCVIVWTCMGFIVRLPAVFAYGQC